MKKVLSKWRQSLAAVFTLGAMVSGFISILASAQGNFYESAQLIMLAMILDGLDGNIARWLRGTTSFGAELDTFVDITCFGVAPAVLAYFVALQHFGLPGMILACSIVLSGMLRLARFKVIDPYHGQRGYTGLPITINAGALALAVLAVEANVLDPEQISLIHGPFALAVWINCAAMLILQVSTVHYQKPTKRLWFMVPSMLLVLGLFLGRHVAVLAAVCMLASGLLYAYVTPFIPAPLEEFSEEEEEEDEEDEPVPFHES